MASVDPAEWLNQRHMGTEERGDVHGEREVSHQGSGTEALHLPKLDTQGAANVTHESSKSPLLCFQSALRRPKALDVENQVWLL